MKKNDLRNDPLRDKMLQGLSFLSKNKYAFGIGVAISIALLVLILSKYESNNTIDHSLCFDKANDPNLEQYCGQEGIKNAISEISKDKNSNQYLLLFLNNFSKTDNDKKLEELQKLDFGEIQALEIKSMLYKIYGDLLFDKGSNKESIEKYEKALEIIDNKRTYSALINYKIATVYFSDEKYTEAKTYADKALDCDFSDKSSSIITELEQLHARINQRLK